MTQTRTEVSRALYLSMVREVFALSELSSVTDSDARVDRRETYETADGSSVRATDMPPAEVSGRDGVNPTQYAGQGTAVMALQDRRKRSELYPAAGHSQRSDDAGSTPLSDGSASAAVAVARTTFALSAAPSTAISHAESIDGAAVIASSSLGPAARVGLDRPSVIPPADRSEVLTVTQRDGLSRLARCVDCGHGLVEGERCGGRAAFPCVCVPFAGAS